MQIKDLTRDDYITQVACGAYHTLFLSDKQKVYGVGLNDFGQLGLGQEENLNSATLVSELSDKGINSISAGESSYGLSSEGKLYVWGLFDKTINTKPQVIESIQKPIK